MLPNGSGRPRRVGANESILHADFLRPWPLQYVKTKREIKRVVNGCTLTYRGRANVRYVLIPENIRLQVISPRDILQGISEAVQAPRRHPQAPARRSVRVCG